MPVDVQISFRGMAASPSVEAQVRHRADELWQFSDRVHACRVTLKAAHRSHRQGTIYEVRIELLVPGGELVVNRESGLDHAHEDMHVAVRDAFDAARRRLQDHKRRFDGRTKLHAGPSVGRVAQVFAERDYVFVETDAGQEIYVHRNAVADGSFDRLKIGDRVRYIIDSEEGDHGPQASTVVPLNMPR
jgi:cold shock CspA family protein/ribosome-associated translation inhibitor RaiA